MTVGLYWFSQSIQEACVCVRCVWKCVDFLSGTDNDATDVYALFMSVEVNRTFKQSLMYGGRIVVVCRWQWSLNALGNVAQAAAVYIPHTATSNRAKLVIKTVLKGKLQI
jgi:hypothetical protein